MSSKCTQTKVVLQDSPEFKIFNAYTQKQVPGEQTQKPYIEFGFEVEGLTKGTVLDSIFYVRGKSINIKSDGRKRIKFPGKVVSKNESDEQEAIIYYTQKGLKYYYVIHDIEIKETLYLP